MPKFFFHVQTIDGVNEEDTVGADFPTVEEAVAEAETLANEMMLDATKARHNVRQVIEVADERGSLILRLDCRAAIEATVRKPPDHV